MKGSAAFQVLASSVLLVTLMASCSVRNSPVTPSPMVVSATPTSTDVAATPTVIYTPTNQIFTLPPSNTTPTPTCGYVGSSLRVLLVDTDNANLQEMKNLNAAVSQMGYCSLSISFTTQNNSNYDGGDISTSNYDVVMVWTKDTNFTDSNLGNSLGAYVSAGGALVMMNSCFVSGDEIPGFDYAADSPFLTGTAGAASGTLGVFNSANPIMKKVSAFSTNVSDITASVSVNSGATSVASYGDGNSCVAVRTVGGGRVVGLNFYGTDVTSGDGQKIILNSALWAAGRI